MSKKVFISKGGSIGFIKSNPAFNTKIEFQGPGNIPDPIKETMTVSADKERWNYWQKNANKKSVMREIRKNRIK